MLFLQIKTHPSVLKRYFLFKLVFLAAVNFQNKAQVQRCTWMKQFKSVYHCRNTINTSNIIRRNDKYIYTVTEISWSFPLHFEATISLHDQNLEQQKIFPFLRSELQYYAVLHKFCWNRHIHTFQLINELILKA